MLEFGLAGEEGVGEEELGEDAAGGPQVDGGGVVGGREEKLGGTVPDCDDAGGERAGGVDAGETEIGWVGQRA